MRSRPVALDIIETLKEFPLLPPSASQVVVVLEFLIFLSELLYLSPALLSILHNSVLGQLTRQLVSVLVSLRPF